MTFQPDGFPRNNLAEIGGNAGTLRNHGVGPDVRHTAGGIGRAAVGFGCVAVPAPQNALDHAHAVKAENGRVLIRHGLDHGRARRLLVVAVVLAVPGHVAPCQGRAETAHDVQCLVMVHDVLQFLDEFRRFHFALSFRVCGAFRPSRDI